MQISHLHGRIAIFVSLHVACGYAVYESRDLRRPQNRPDVSAPIYTSAVCRLSRLPYSLQCSSMGLGRSEIRTRASTSQTHHLCILARLVRVRTSDTYDHQLLSSTRRSGDSRTHLLPCHGLLLLVELLLSGQGGLNG